MFPHSSTNFSHPPPVAPKFSSAAERNFPFETKSPGMNFSLNHSQLNSSNVSNLQTLQQENSFLHHELSLFLQRESALHDSYRRKLEDANTEIVQLRDSLFHSQRRLESAESALERSELGSKSQLALIDQYRTQDGSVKAQLKRIEEENFELKKRLNEQIQFDKENFDRFVHPLQSKFESQSILVEQLEKELSETKRRAAQKATEVNSLYQRLTEAHKMNNSGLNHTGIHGISQEIQELRQTVASKSSEISILYSELAAANRKFSESKEIMKENSLNQAWNEKRMAEIRTLQETILVQKSRIEALEEMNRILLKGGKTPVKEKEKFEFQPLNQDELWNNQQNNNNNNNQNNNQNNSLLQRFHASLPLPFGQNQHFNNNNQKNSSFSASNFLHSSPFVESNNSIQNNNNSITTTEHFLNQSNSSSSNIFTSTSNHPPPNCSNSQCRVHHEQQRQEIRELFSRISDLNDSIVTLQAEKTIHEMKWKKLEIQIQHGNNNGNNNSMNNNNNNNNSKNSNSNNNNNNNNNNENNKNNEFYKERNRYLEQIEDQQQKINELMEELNEIRDQLEKSEKNSEIQIILQFSKDISWISSCIKILGNELNLFQQFLIALMNGNEPSLNCLIELTSEMLFQQIQKQSEEYEEIKNNNIQIKEEEKNNNEIIQIKDSVKELKSCIELISQIREQCSTAYTRKVVEKQCAVQ